MERYGKARIYKLVGGGKTYYGSTCETLSRRLSGHKADYKRFLNGKRHYNLTAFELLEEPDLDIVLVEEYPCENKDQLRARERYWIENNECVNKFIPTRTMKEWCEDTKELRKAYDKVYRETNKVKINERKKAYYEANKDKINERRRANKK